MLGLHEEQSDDSLKSLVIFLMRSGVILLEKNDGSGLQIFYKNSQSGEYVFEDVGSEKDTAEERIQKLKDIFGYVDDIKSIKVPEQIQKDAFSIILEETNKYCIIMGGRAYEMMTMGSEIIVDYIKKRFEEIENKIKQEALNKLNAQKRIKQTLTSEINLKSFLGQIETAENGEVTILLNYNLEAFAKYLVDKNATSTPEEEGGEQLITLADSENIDVIKKQIQKLEEIKTQVQAINQSLKTIGLPNASNIKEIEEKKQEILEERQRRELDKQTKKQTKQTPPQPQVSGPEVQDTIVAKPNPIILLDTGFFIKIDERLGIETLKQVLSFLQKAGFNLVITTEITNELVSVRYDDIRGYLKRVTSKLTLQEKRIAKDLGEDSLLSLFEKQPQYSHAVFCTGDGNFVQKRISEGLNNPIFIHPALLLIIAATNNAALLKELIEEQKIPQGLKSLELKDRLLIEDLNKLLEGADIKINLISIIRTASLQLSTTQGNRFNRISYIVHSNGRSI
jgi:hypothetical protein